MRGDPRFGPEPLEAWFAVYRSRKKEKSRSWGQGVESRGSHCKHVKLTMLFAE